MNGTLEFVVRSLVLGIGATIVLDLWAQFLRVFGVKPGGMGMLGRWAGHLPRGRLVHDGIANTPPVRHEAALGWITHYAVGIVFGVLFLAIVGLEWTRVPTFLPALAFGVATVVFPFLFMQPSMGAGFFASKTSKPNVARLRSLMGHTVFGIGLYLTGLIVAAGE